jgi:hypothetical protein
MLRKVLIVLCFCSLLWVASPQPVFACTQAPTFTPTWTPTPTSTPDAAGYIPPSPTPTATYTPYPTRTPVPLRTRVAAYATTSPLIVEGEVVYPGGTPVSYYSSSQLKAHFVVDQVYRGEDDSIIEFEYFVIPCPGERPRFADSLEGVYFFVQRDDGRYVYNGHLPADDAVRQNVSVVVGPGQQPRNANAAGLPLAIGFLLVNLVVWSLALRRLWLRRQVRF